MKYWPAVVSATVALAVGIPVVHELAPNLRLFERAAEASSDESSAREALGSSHELALVQVDRMFLGGEVATAPAGAGNVAELTVIPRVQKAALESFKSRRVPSGGAVMMELRTGDILAYAGKRGGEGKEDLLTAAKAPAADIFKLVTATALVNMTGATADTRICYRDAGRKLELEDLVEEREKDHWCPTLSEALARNFDEPFARAGFRKLSAEVIEKTAAAYGFGGPIPFDFEVEASHVRIPATDMGLVETAIGADHATMSVLQGLLLASSIASKGVVVQPYLVRSIHGPDGKALYRKPPNPRFIQRAIPANTARELAAMMIDTTEIGDGFRAFHDDTGHLELGVFKAAGKTGADRDEKAASQVTWFVGFAPIEHPEVAIATVARHSRGASGNAQHLARDMLHAYFEPRLPKKGDETP